MKSPKQIQIIGWSLLIIGGLLGAFSLAAVLVMTASSIGVPDTWNAIITASGITLFGYMIYKTI